MKTITFAAVCLVLALLNTTSAQTCPCVDADPNLSCKLTRETLTGGCEEVFEPCSGCFCDLSGDKICTTETRETVLLGVGGTCETVSRTAVVCPGLDQDPNTEPDTGELKTTCTVSGPASTEYTCIVDCFDENLGTLNDLTISYNVSFSGFFQVTNNQNGDATDVSISQSATLEAYGSTNDFLFFEVDGIDLQPTLNSVGLASGQTISENTLATDEAEESFPVTGDGAEYLTCSTNNGGTAETASITILGLLSTIAPATFSTTTQGDMSATFTVIYSYTPNST